MTGPVPVGVWQALGLGGALLLHLAFLGAARLLARDLWPLAYPALIVAISSLLTWQGLFEVRWSAPVAAVALAAAALMDVRRRGLPRVGQLDVPDALAVAALGFNALWAAFPAYRYDQWNDHLVIPKVLAREGPLRAPIFNDHVFFTGSYEFFLTIPRWLSGNDIFNQCFANAFGWLVLCFGAWGAVSLVRRVLPSALPSPLLVTCFIAFTLPEEEAILNAKPDVVLFVAGLALLIGIALLDRPDGASPRLEALVGFLFVAPLALKSTWLLGALSIGIAVVLTILAGRSEIAGALRRRWIWVGATLGVLAVVPYFAKNVRFLGNPLHPVQFGPFRSTFWGPGLEAYYGYIGGARSVARYLDELAAAPRLLAVEGLEAVAIPLLAVGIGLVTLLIEGVRTAGRPAGALGMRAAAALAVFLLLWPLAMPVGFYPRYYYVAFSLIAAIALTLLAWAWPLVRPHRAARLAVIGLLLSPPVVKGGFVAKGTRMLKGARQEPGAFVRDQTPKGETWSRLQTVNAHRRQAFPGAPFATRIALTDTPSTYFLDSASLAAGGREYVSHRAWTGAACIWQLLDRLDVAYVVSVERPFRQWPREIAAALPQLTKLDESGHVFYVDRDLARRLAQADPACR